MTGKKRGRPAKKKIPVETPKRGPGRPATGRSERISERNHAIYGWYTQARLQGASEGEAMAEVAELLVLNGYVEPNEDGNYDPDDGEYETIRAALKESRRLTIADDDFKHSVRLQKDRRNAPWQAIFEIDPETGEVVPKLI